MAKKVDKPLKFIVKKRMDEQGMKVADLSRQTGIPVKRMYKWFSDSGTQANPKGEDIAILQEWLSKPKGGEQVLQEPTYREQLFLTKNLNNSVFAPFIPYKARAGYGKSYDQTDYLEQLDQFELPPKVQYRGADWRWFEVGGNSMENTLHDGDVVLASSVPYADWHDDLKEFYIHVIVVKNDVLVKRIAYRPSNREQLVLISDNGKEYEQTAIDIADIRELWRVRRHLNARLGAGEAIRVKI